MTESSGKLPTSEIAAAAEALYGAERTRIQVRPTSALYPDMNLADAYAVQDAVIARRVADGRRVIGRKIGLTSKAMQRAMHIDEPDYGTLLDDMQFADGARIAAADFTDPRIEVELAFVLDRALTGTTLSAADVLAATRHVIPAMELIAARSFRVDPETGRPRGLLDTVSDNAAAAGVILGRPFEPGSIDLRWCGAILRRNGEVEETGLAAGVLDHPANGVAWLARRFSAHGITLEPGQVILAGSFTRPIEVRPGDAIEADFGTHGTVSCWFD